MKRTTTIGFREFMAGDNGGRRRRTARPIYSYLPPVTLGSFFDGGMMLVVLGSAAVALLSYALEATAEAHGHSELAATIESATRFLFTLSGFGAIAWFMVSL